MSESVSTHRELVEQAEKVLKLTEQTSYYPKAHAEAERLQHMIEERREAMNTDN
jgi:hypothetical protein